MELLTVEKRRHSGDIQRKVVFVTDVKKKTVRLSYWIAV